MVIMGYLAPEMVTIWAGRQYLAACNFSKKNHELDAAQLILPYYGVHSSRGWKAGTGTGG